jgi:hypothetical protein
MSRHARRDCERPGYQVSNAGYHITVRQCFVQYKVTGADHKACQSCRFIVASVHVQALEAKAEHRNKGGNEYA